MTSKTILAVLLLAIFVGGEVALATERAEDVSGEVDQLDASSGVARKLLNLKKYVIPVKKVVIPPPPPPKPTPAPVVVVKKAVKPLYYAYGKKG